MTALNFTYTPDMAFDGLPTWYSPSGLGVIVRTNDKTWQALALDLEGEYIDHEDCVSEKLALMALGRYEAAQLLDHAVRQFELSLRVRDLSKTEQAWLDKARIVRAHTQGAAI
jgi:hypothetical protein